MSEPFDSPLQISVPYSRQLISKLSAVQEHISGRKRRLVTIITSIICVLIGIRFIGNISAPYNTFFTLYGCLALAFMSVPAKWRAEKICSMIEKSGRGYPCSVFEFQDGCFLANTKGNTGKPVENSYAKCHKLIETDYAFYYFINPEAAFPIPFADIPEGKKDALKSFLEEKTHLSFIPYCPLWRFSLQRLLFERKNTRKI